MYFSCIIAPTHTLHTYPYIVTEGRAFEILQIPLEPLTFVNNKGLLFFQRKFILYCAIERLKITLN